MKATLIVALCAIGVGCTPSTAPVEIGNPLLNASLWFVQPGGYISSDDTVGTRAIVYLYEDYDQSIDPVTGLPLPPWTYRKTYIDVHEMIPFPWPLAELLVNDSVLNRANGWRLSTYNDDGFRTHFEQGATSNTLRKAADDYIGALDTTVAFGEHIRFTDVKVGDTINTSSDRAFTHSGPSGNMEVTIQAYVPLGSDILPSSITKSFFGHKDGTITLPLSQLRGFTDVEGRIEIIRWDMRFLPTSNGTKIAYVARTSHSMSVRLVR